MTGIGPVGIYEFAHALSASRRYNELAAILTPHLRRSLTCLHPFVYHSALSISSLMLVFRDDHFEGNC